MYNTIYADPPWSYDNKKTGGTMASGASDKYSLMTLEDIKAMPIQGITAPNAVLFMWGTVPLLPEALEVLQAWGFRYKTKITWEKTGCFGMGHWLRIQDEFMLVGVKGKVKPFKHQEKNIYKHPICAHSAKPHFFRRKVEELAGKSFDKVRKLELFARSREGMFPDYEYEGWDVYGNQVNNSIELAPR